MTTDILRPDKPDYYTVEELYDPINYPNGTGTIHPQVGSLVSVGNVLKKITSIADNYAITYEDVFMNDLGNRTIVSDYGNDKYGLFVDPRATPFRAAISSRLVFTGTQMYAYTLTRYPGTSNEVVISSYYDATNTYVSKSVPMTNVGSNNWVCADCLISAQPSVNEEIRLDVFNKTGAIVDSTILYTKSALIINESLGYQPKITGISLSCTQMRSDGTFYVFEKQDFSDLAVTATLTYADGTTREVPIDRQRCWLYGQEDFIASFAGMRQSIMVKYFLSSDEALAGDLGDTGDAITQTVDVVVVPNSLASTFKLSVIPVWVNSAAKYVLRYYYYTTDFSTVRDVTAFVTLVENEGTFDGANYGPWQQFVVSLDMNKVDPTTYQTSATYTQNVCVRLQPIAAYDRYLIRDAMSSTSVYGVDATGNRRPVLHYDASRRQYFIPTDIFQNEESVMTSFYTNASPPYNPITETVPPTPTHFVLRDPVSGQMLVQSPIAVSNYGVAFSIVGDTTGKYVNSNVIVEFMAIPDSSTSDILYGVPVDVYTGTYLGNATPSGS